MFRAVDTLRSVSASLEDTHSAADLSFAHFDEGFVSGYDEGFDRGGSDQSSTAQVDFHIVGCELPEGAQIFPAQRAIVKATVAALPWAMLMGFCCVLRVAGWKPASNPKQHSSILALQLQYMYPAK